MRTLTLVTAVAVALVASAVAERNFTEDVLLRPLPGLGKVVAHFRFKQGAAGSTVPSEQHFGSFPKHIRQVMHKFDVDAFQLTFTNGLWRHGQWGEALGHGPFGALLEANVPSEAAFQGLAQTLAGIFSASLNKMNARAVNTKGSFAYQANLAREELCTENLSPWLKLLPCRAHAGLGTFVHPLHVLDSDFISMSVRVTRDLAMEQSLTFVKRVDGHDWTLASLLGAASTTVCPLATQSSVTTELSTDKSSALMLPPTTVERHRNAYRHIVPLATVSSVDAPWLAAPAPAAAKSTWSSVSAHRYLTGYGQVRGGIAIALHNRDTKTPVRVSYDETIPWYLRVYFSTLRVALNGRLLTSSEYALEMTPASRTGSPGHLRLVLELPPKSRIDIGYAFDKAFLPLEAHPPDANRGFDVAAARVRVDRGKATTTLYTEPLLVPLPTPDFSMPYNVICLTSTVVSMTLGSLVNTLLRHERKKTNIAKLFDVLKQLFRKIKPKQA
ncbi:GPI transamidase component [Achlya hypogyna]|uniref:GPI transamidase component n=1 Tax=Achlya hypogyna TaxID=1202772 RepID=A0A1V9YBD6_ACHHY|nr:GPI transamidase component [Achlya hypogyna]